LSWAVAMERPEDNSNTLIPNFGSYIQYDIAGGHQVQAVGEIADLAHDPLTEDFGRGHDRGLGWMVGAGANINLADIATLTAGAMYTEGLAGHWLNQLSSTQQVCEDAEVPGTDLPSAVCNDFSGSFQRGWGVTAGLTFNVNETTSLNVEGGYAKNIDASQNDLLLVDHVWTVHGNILWQPVKQMRMGWEVMWGKEQFTDHNSGCELQVNPEGNHGDVCGDSADAVRLQWGTWFFF
jgi:hypothetical protein